MSLFVLIPGAGGSAWYWHRIVPELRARGHEAVAVNLPGADESAGLPEYADAVVAAIGGRHDVVVVGQSMGGFTAPTACARTHTRMLVLVNAMIPVPGETAGAWWGNTGWDPARIAAAQAGGYPVEFDLAAYFLHDVPHAVLQDAPPPREEVGAAFEQPCRFRAWPQPLFSTLSELTTTRFTPPPETARTTPRRPRVPAGPPTAPPAAAVERVPPSTAAPA